MKRRIEVEKRRDKRLEEKRYTIWTYIHSYVRTFGQSDSSMCLTVFSFKYAAVRVLTVQLITIHVEV